MGLIQNNVMKQRLTKNAQSRLRVVCATRLQKRLPRHRLDPGQEPRLHADVNGTYLDQKYSGTILSPGIPAVAKLAARYELKDQDAINVLLRAQRNF